MRASGSRWQVAVAALAVGEELSIRSSIRRVGPRSEFRVHPRAPVWKGERGSRRDGAAFTRERCDRVELRAAGGPAGDAAAQLHIGDRPRTSAAKTRMPVDEHRDNSDRAVDTEARRRRSCRRHAADPAGAAERSRTCRRSSHHDDADRRDAPNALTPPQCRDVERPPAIAPSASGRVNVRRERARTPLPRAPAT